MLFLCEQKLHYVPDNQILSIGISKKSLKVSKIIFSKRIVKTIRKVNTSKVNFPTDELGQKISQIFHFGLNTQMPYFKPSSL